MKDLMMLIKSSPFAEVQSIIIYCKFQYETDLISKYLSDNNIQAMDSLSYTFLIQLNHTWFLTYETNLFFTITYLNLSKKKIIIIINKELPQWYTLKGSKSYSGIILFQQDKSGKKLFWFTLALKLIFISNYVVRCHDIWLIHVLELFSGRLLQLWHLAWGLIRVMLEL
ncbi:unnamed protein product [Camellia sinensis]